MCAAVDLELAAGQGTLAETAALKQLERAALQELERESAEIAGALDCAPTAAAALAEHRGGDAVASDLSCRRRAELGGSLGRRGTAQPASAARAAAGGAGLE